MNLAMFDACVAGYKERMFDLELTTVYSGYWSAYFMSPKSKSLKSVMTELINAHDKPTQVHSDEVDVNTFLERERRFKEQLSLQRK